MSSNLTVRKHYMMMPINYIEQLQRTGKRDKARAFMEYFYDMHDERINSLRFYAISWDVSKSTVENWIKDFKIEIDNFFSYWTIHNQSHHKNTLKNDGQKVDTLKKKTGHHKVNQSTIISDVLKVGLDTSKRETGHPIDKEANKNIYNINVDSKESTSNKKIRNEYSKEFEILWNLYDKKSSSKKRAHSIFNKRWKSINPHYIKKAIKSYKSETNPTYIKDFDGFLNGVIDNYIAKRVWIKDKKGNIHQGNYTDFDNKFISDAAIEFTLESSAIASYLENGHFGYLNN